MSSIVCQKCRRLVRKSNIDYHGGDYFCPKCQISYKLPASYYKRGELSIPVLPKNTSLKVHKSETELLIELPMHIFTFGFTISTVFVFFVSLMFLPIYLETKEVDVLWVLLVLACFFVFLLINTMSKKSILVKEGNISFRKNILGLIKLEDKEDFKKVRRIRQIEVENENGNGKYISGRFIEVYVNRDNSWEFGHNLEKADREYVIAELKLFHFYNQML